MLLVFKAETYGAKAMWFLERAEDYKDWRSDVFYNSAFDDVSNCIEYALMDIVSGGGHGQKVQSRRRCLVTLSDRAKLPCISNYRAYMKYLEERLYERRIPVRINGQRYTGWEIFDKFLDVAEYVVAYARIQAMYRNWEGEPMFARDFRRQVFGFNLRRWRVHAGMTQSELFKVCGFKEQTTLSQYERGCTGPSPSNLAKMCAVLHVTKEELYQGIYSTDVMRAC